MDFRVLPLLWQWQKQTPAKQSSGSCQPSVLQADDNEGAEEWRVTGKVKGPCCPPPESFPFLLGPRVQTLGQLFEYFVLACYTDPCGGYLQAPL